MSQLVIAKPSAIESLVSTWPQAFREPILRKRLNPGTGRDEKRPAWFPEPRQSSQPDVDSVRTKMEMLRPFSEFYDLSGRGYEEGLDGWVGVAVGYRLDEDGWWSFPLFRIDAALERDFGSDPVLSRWLAPDALRGLGAYVFVDD